MGRQTLREREREREREEGGGGREGAERARLPICDGLYYLLEQPEVLFCTCIDRSNRNENEWLSD